MSLKANIRSNFDPVMGRPPVSPEQVRHNKHVQQSSTAADSSVKSNEMKYENKWEFIVPRGRFVTSTTTERYFQTSADKRCYKTIKQ